VRSYAQAPLAAARDRGALVSCQEGPVGLPTTSAGAPALAISDAAHNGDTEHFFFLPPLVPAPAFGGAADADLNPTVAVCEWGDLGCVEVVANFDRESGTGSELVRYDATSEHYIVNWHTDRCVTGDCTLDPTKTYRIRVLAGALELGYADVDVVTTGRELRNVQTDEYIGLVNGRTLPVKFRIEHGIVARVDVVPSEARIEVSGRQQFTATATDLHGEPLTGLPTTWSSSRPEVASVDGDGLATGAAAGAAVITAAIRGLEGTASLLVEDGRTEWAMVSAGGEHSCGLRTDGAAYCWGQNRYGQLGDGTNNNRLVPIAVRGGHTFSTIDAGFMHTCALTLDGEAYCWGQNETGALGIGVSGFTEDRNFPSEVVDNHVSTSVAAGGSFTCALDRGGAAWCWGNGLVGQLGRGFPEGSSRPVAVSGQHVFRSVAAGETHVCGVTTTDRPFCWGLNRWGQIGDGTFDNRFVPTFARVPAPVGSVGLGAAHSCAVTRTGEGYCWGANNPGQLGLGDITDPIPTPQLIPRHSFTSITPGTDFTCAIASTSGGLCWGYGVNGQRGDGTPTITASPTPVVVVPSFVQLDAGGAHACGVAPGGAAYCWGGSPISLGRLGHGAAGGSNVPVAVAEP
jgi:alpha-tubulin suppressor-like RCC1 family protein